MKHLLNNPTITSIINPRDIIKGNLYNPQFISYLETEDYGFQESSFLVKSEHSNTRYKVEIDVDENNNELVACFCTCPIFRETNSCKHIGAVLANYYDILFNITNVNEISETLLNKFYSESINKVRKEVNILFEITTYDNYRYYYQDTFDVRISIGLDKMYNLNNKLNRFLEYYEGENGTFKFGKNFEYDSSIHYIAKENIKALEAYHQMSDTYHYDRFKRVKEFLKTLKNIKFIINNYVCNGIKEGFPLNSFLTKNENEYQVKFDLDNLKMLINDDYEYVLYQNSLYHLNKQERVLLKDIVDNNLEELKIKKDNFNKFTKGLFNILKNNIEIDGNIDNIVIPKSIATEIYFDLRENMIKAQPKFKYDEEEVEYFDNNSLVLRDMSYENEVINDLLKYGFILENKEITLSDLEKQVEFIEDGLEELASKYVIFTTEKFKNTNIRKKTNISSMFGIGQDNILSYNFDLGDINSEELVNIFKEIKNKKKYYRLKNGDILNLEDESLQELENLVEDLEFSDEDIINGKGNILKYRAIYLDSLKSSKYNIIKTDNLFDNFISNFYAYKNSELTLTKKDLSKLRDYQITGVKWLYNLAKTGFGGILADEMGLGKTIQVIFYLKQILKENKDAKFLVVVPTSLAYNWEHEFELHSNDIKRVICTGIKSKREEILSNLDNVNVIVTTYGLLREDEDLYLDKHFHTIIIDEAQNIKNNLAGITKVVKKINADTKFALTGTPLENSILELWSIFDFIMPGYLAKLTKFQSKYRIKDFDEDSEKLIKGLNRQINPFILRRKKTDVTKELPDKLINDIYIELAPEQKKLYVAELEKVKEEIDNLMQTEGMTKVRFLILTLLTKLRQLCIDPSILYEDYNGGSNKIDTLVNIVNEYTKNNHKILIFSSFKTALNIVKKTLMDNKINSYMIDGSVSSLKRMEMVDDFNNKEDVKVFLIMLKSGGTGLNLTSADVVIHLDLWWNPQAENQATDRAHRIGQTKNVEVIHLVTKGTIEEKILDLQNKKRILSDKIIDGEVRDKNIISDLTKEDIKNLLAFENKN